MASIETLQGLQDRLHQMFEGDQSTPDSTAPSDDWAIRTNFINEGIHHWEKDNAANWRDLWNTLTAASDGTKTLTSGTTSYAAPTNFIRPGGFVRITPTDGSAVKYYEIVPATNVQLFDGQTTKFAYFAGNRAQGYKMYLNPAPTTTGDAINYDYYQKATELAATGDKTECPNPSFLIHFALSALYRQQRDMARATDELATAEDLLATMHAENSLDPRFQGNSLPDLSRLQGKGFGTSGRGFSNRISTSG